MGYSSYDPFAASPENIPSYEPNWDFSAPQSWDNGFEQMQEQQRQQEEQQRELIESLFKQQAEQQAQQEMEAQPAFEQGSIGGMTSIPDDDTYGITGSPQPNSAETEEYESKQPSVPFMDWDPLSIAKDRDPEAFKPGGIPLTKNQKVKLALNDAASLLGTLFHDAPLIEDTKLFRAGFEKSQEKLLAERRKMAFTSAQKQIAAEQWQMKQAELAKAAAFREKKNQETQKRLLMGATPVVIDPTTQQMIRLATPQEIDMLMEENASPGVTHPNLPMIIPMTPAMKAGEGEQARLKEKDKFDKSPEGRAAAAREQSDSANKVARDEAARTAQQVKDKTKVRDEDGNLVTPVQKNAQERRDQKDVAAAEKAALPVKTTEQARTTLDETVEIADPKARYDGLVALKENLEATRKSGVALTEDVAIKLMQELKKAEKAIRGKR